LRPRPCRRRKFRRANCNPSTWRPEESTSRRHGFSWRRAPGPAYGAPGYGSPGPAYGAPPYAPPPPAYGAPAYYRAPGVYPAPPTYIEPEPVYRSAYAAEYAPRPPAPIPYNGYNGYNSYSGYNSHNGYNGGGRCVVNLGYGRWSHC